MLEHVEFTLGPEVSESIELLRESSIELEYKIDINYECEGSVKDIRVDIVEHDMDDDCNESVENLGSVKINMLRHLYLMDYEEAYDICDIISQNFVDGFVDCFKDEHSKNKSKFSLNMFNEYIYIDTLQMTEKSRGKGIGSAVIREIIDTIGKPDSLFVIIPFAFEDRDNEKSHKRVKKFWSNLGFKKMRNSNYYYYNENLE